MTNTSFLPLEHGYAVPARLGWICHCLPNPDLQTVAMFHQGRLTMEG